MFNLNGLISSLHDYSDNFLVTDPIFFSATTVDYCEITVSALFGGVRHIVIDNSGTASWLDHSIPRQLHTRRLPRNTDRAAEVVAGLVYGD